MKLHSILSVFLIMVLLISGCTYQKDVSSENKKISVIVTLLPQKAFVEAVGGDNVKVTVLIPPGGSPATYEPNPGDLVAVENADIWFRIGHVPFEKANMDSLSELNPKMSIIDTSHDVNLRYFEEHDDHKEETEEDGNIHDDHDHTGVDPHIWLSPLAVKLQVDTISRVLSAADPDNAKEYMANAMKFKQELDELHDEISDKFSVLDSKILMVFHPSWGYFADEYGLEQIAIEQSGKEPTAEQLQNMIFEAREKDVKVIFVQSQFSRDIAESISEEIGSVVVSIDPLAENYVENMRSIATVIAENLKN